ncbi:MAG: alpha/beta hydrolase [Parvularculaceae bacterium]
MSPQIITAFVVVALFALGGCASLYAEKKAPPIGEFEAVDGARIHLVDEGRKDAEGPALVLIHGASVNLRDMKIGLGDTLAKTHRVILVDRPGKGYSSRPDSAWMLDEQAKLIHDAVVELGVEKPIIVGQSFGGAVALSYALQFQADMSGLVLLAPVSHKWPGGVSWYNKVSGWPVAGFLLRRLVIPVYAPLVAKAGVNKSFAPNDPPPNYYEEAGIPLLFRPGDFRSNAEDLRKLKPQIIEMSKRYDEIKLATLIMAGDQDHTVSPKLHAQTLVTEIPNARLIMLPGVGHALHHAETGRIVAEINAMADEVSRKTVAAH